MNKPRGDTPGPLLIPPAWSSWTPWLRGLSLPEDFFPKAEKFLTALAAANDTVNLVSYQNPEALKAHAVDALQALRAPAANAARVIDVGTGGGFPGVPLALARPGWTVTLLDAVQKKGRALEEVLTPFALPGRPLWARAEELARDRLHRDTYDIALCRAVGRLSTVLELTLPFLRVGGRALLHRGADTPAETASARQAIHALGGNLGPLIPYRLPGLNLDRFILCIDKTHQTDESYPRRSGVPAKRPL